MGTRELRARRALLGVVVAVSVFATGCEGHRVAATHPCPELSRGGKVVVARNRGATGLAKIGLASKVLKAQEKCS